MGGSGERKSPDALRKLQTSHRDEKVSGRTDVAVGGGKRAPQS